LLRCKDLKVLFSKLSHIFGRFVQRLSSVTVRTQNFGSLLEQLCICRDDSLFRSGFRLFVWRVCNTTSLLADGHLVGRIVVDLAILGKETDQTIFRRNPAKATIKRVEFALLNCVFLFGVPRCRPPRRSPGFEPLGICYFANFWDGPELTNVRDVNAGLSQ
jgi:hypothetical protein